MKRTIFTALMATALTMPAAAHAMTDGLFSGAMNSGVGATLASAGSGSGTGSSTGTGTNNTNTTTNNNTNEPTAPTMGGATTSLSGDNIGGGANANIGGGASADANRDLDADIDTGMDTNVRTGMDSNINDDDFDANGGVSTRATTNTRNNEYNPSMQDGTTASNTRGINGTASQGFGETADTMSMQNVTIMQQKLENRGYYDGNIDGIWGPRTERALTQFQQDNNLSVTGRADAQTIRELGLTTSLRGSTSAGAGY